MMFPVMKITKKATNNNHNMIYKGFKIEKQIRLAKNGKEYTEGYNITFPNEKHPC